MKPDNPNPLVSLAVRISAPDRKEETKRADADIWAICRYLDFFDNKLIYIRI